MRTLLAAALLTLAACGSSTTEPEPAQREAPGLAGSYVMVEGGRSGAYTPPPVAVAGFPTFHGSTLEIRSDGTATLATDTETNGVRRTQSAEATVRIANATTFSLHFAHSGATRAGKVEADGRVSIDWEHFKLFYEAE